MPGPGETACGDRHGPAAFSEPSLPRPVAARSRSSPRPAWGHSWWTELTAPSQLCRSAESGGRSPSPLPHVQVKAAHAQPGPSAIDGSLCSMGLARLLAHFPAPRRGWGWHTEHLVCQYAGPATSMGRERWDPNIVARHAQRPPTCLQKHTQVRVASGSLGGCLCVCAQGTFPGELRMARRASRSGCGSGAPRPAGCFVSVWTQPGQDGPALAFWVPCTLELQPPTHAGRQ